MSAIANKLDVYTWRNDFGRKSGGVAGVGRNRPGEAGIAKLGAAPAVPIDNAEIHPAGDRDPGPDGGIHKEGFAASEGQRFVLDEDAAVADGDSGIAGNELGLKIITAGTTYGPVGVPVEFDRDGSTGGSANDVDDVVKLRLGTGAVARLLKEWIQAASSDGGESTEAADGGGGTGVSDAVIVRGACARR